MENMRNPARRAEAYHDGMWHEIPFQDLKKYDVFKLYEHDGKPVIDTFKDKDGTEQKSSISVAIGNAYLGDEDVLTIKCVPLPPDTN